MRIPIEGEGNNYRVLSIPSNKKQYLENLLKNNGDINKSYLRQLGSKNSPDIKDNAHNLARILSHNKVHQIIYLHKRKIDKILEITRERKKRSRLPLLSNKKLSYNLSPYMQPCNIC